MASQLHLIKVKLTIWGKIILDELYKLGDYSIGYTCLLWLSCIALILYENPSSEGNV